MDKSIVLAVANAIDLAFALGCDLQRFHHASDEPQPHIIAARAVLTQYGEGARRGAVGQHEDRIGVAVVDEFEIEFVESARFRGVSCAREAHGALDNAAPAGVHRLVAHSAWQWRQLLCRRSSRKSRPASDVQAARDCCPGSAAKMEGARRAHSRFSNWHASTQQNGQAPKCRTGTLPLLYRPYT